jgi:hypothetical protein
MIVPGNRFINWHFKTGREISTRIFYILIEVKRLFGSFIVGIWGGRSDMNLHEYGEPGWVSGRLKEGLLKLHTVKFRGG